MKKAIISLLLLVVPVSNVELTLKAGAYLHILNGGIIVIKNKFEATVGATVDIDSGQIL